MRPASFAISGASKYGSRGATHQALGNGAANLSFYFRPDGTPALASPFSQAHSLIGSPQPVCSADLPARITPIKGPEWDPPLRRRTRTRPDRFRLLGLPIRNPWQSLYGSRRWHPGNQWATDKAGVTRADKQLSNCHTLAHVCGWAGRLWLFVLPVSDIGPGRL